MSRACACSPVRESAALPSVSRICGSSGSAAAAALRAPRARRAGRPCRAGGRSARAAPERESGFAATALSSAAFDLGRRRARERERLGQRDLQVTRSSGSPAIIFSYRALASRGLVLEEVEARPAGAPPTSRPGSSCERLVEARRARLRSRASPASRCRAARGRPRRAASSPAFASTASALSYSRRDMCAAYERDVGLHRTPGRRSRDPRGR